MGKGAYGSVSLARSKKTGNQVALKQLDGEQIQMYDKVRSVMREREICFAMKHQHIMRMHHSFTVGFQMLTV